MYNLTQGLNLSTWMERAKLGWTMSPLGRERLYIARLLLGHRVDRLLSGLSSVHMKLELFQRTSTFKVRGAMSTALDCTSRQWSAQVHSKSELLPEWSGNNRATELLAKRFEAADIHISIFCLRTAITRPCNAKTRCGRALREPPVRTPMCYWQEPLYGKR